MEIANNLKNDLKGLSYNNKTYLIRHLERNTFQIVNINKSHSGFNKDVISFVIVYSMFK